MPELPDVAHYVSALDQLLTGETVRGVRVRSPFVLRTFEPDPAGLIGRRVEGFSRRGKRVVWEFGRRGSDDPVWMVVHLMIAGRFHWKKPDYAARGKNDLLAIGFDSGVMALTEASSKKRAGVWLLNSLGEVDALDPGGLDVLTCQYEEFVSRIGQSNNTLKRALTDPRRFDGIGNAFSDEILHAARLSPLKRTGQLDDEEVQRLFAATRKTLDDWTQLLVNEKPGKFPERVTAFRPGMAVHGKFKEPCPVCKTPVQRIRYAANECNYCPRCQTEGKVLSDRSLARLLKDDWPKTVEELEE